MATERKYKIKRELTGDFEAADYANDVHVAGGQHEVVLTFFQIVFPVDEEKDESQVSVRAVPVARVALPTAVALRLGSILGQVKPKAQ